MKYRVGDVLTCNVEHRANGSKAILLGSPREGSTVTEGDFQVLALQETVDWYTVLIPDDFIGWRISTFMIVHANVPKVFMNKKFFDVPESCVVRKKR